MSILVKGDEVDFVLAKAGRGAAFRENRGFSVRFERCPSGARSCAADEGREVLYTPRHYVMCHDVSGASLRRCDFYVCPYRYKTCNACDVDRKTLDAFRKYYGNQVDAEVGTLVMPEGPWQKVALTDAIRYRRRHVPMRGGETLPYKHDWNSHTASYPVAVWLEQSRDGSFRVPLPTGCLADERGFRDP